MSKRSLEYSRVAPELVKVGPIIAESVIRERTQIYNNEHTQTDKQSSNTTS